jgi:anti-anti-sigma factor
MRKAGENRHEQVIELAGEMTSSLLDEFSVQLTEAIASRVDVVVDLTRVTRIDARFLRALVAADKRARAHRHHVVLRGAQGEVRRVLAATGMDSQFDLARS